MTSSVSGCQTSSLAGTCGSSQFQEDPETLMMVPRLRTIIYWLVAQGERQAATNVRGMRPIATEHWWLRLEKWDLTNWSIKRSGLSVRDLILWRGAIPSCSSQGSRKVEPLPETGGMASIHQLVFHGAASSEQ
jgi:hypothetical protein